MAGQPKKPGLSAWPAGAAPGPLSEAPRAGKRLRFIYERLLARFGPRHWWPGESPFEVMVGAVLTQNTAWRNVEKAMANLAAHGLLTAEAMAAVPDETLAGLIRPSGYFNVKARRLKALVGTVLSLGRGGREPDMLAMPLAAQREALLGVTGVGPETADSILLYAANLPSFVVDAYTRRLLSRHGLAKGDEPYGDIRDWFMRHLPPDAPLYNEYHALIVTVGHQKCGPRRPDCPSCPLNDDPLLDPRLAGAVATSGKAFG
ncbi:MAG: endonuclease III domain-containing protein [Deltaproteobacteria bacterium]|nr:endonuclease III domain-containing protein [Deltaproteobacteria bacterium]